MVVKCDQFDYRGDPADQCCYPKYHTDPDDVLKTMAHGDRTMEVYDLSLSIDEQMAERRAWHPPEQEED